MAYVIAMNNSEILRLNDRTLRLNIPDSDWQAALANAKPDPAVGIRHAALSGDVACRIHVAAIPHHVGCHFHKIGDETYEVVQGQGTLHVGKVTSNCNDYRVAWQAPLNVDLGDCFVIPEGYAHQLQKRGSEDLAILFACPDAHLDDEGDRYLLPDCPDLYR